MSSEWLETTLGGFVRLQRGHDLTASEQLPGPYPVMGSAGQNGCHNVAKAKGPGVVVGRSGASMGRVHYSESDYWPHNTCLYVTDFQGNNPRFVYYLLGSLDLAGYNSGSAQPSLNRNYIYSLPLKIPSRVQQDSIVEVLDALDARIDLLRETNTTLESVAQALFKSWFVDFDPVHVNADNQTDTLPLELQPLFPATFTDTPQGLVPDGWQISRLGDITERITKGTTPTTLKKAFTETGINFVKVESLTEAGEFIPEKFAFIDERTHQLLKRSQLQVGDVLVTIAGTIGRVSEVTEDIVPANTNQAVALIRPIPENLPSGLIRRFLQLAHVKQRMGERVVQAVQANLSLGSLSDMLVVVPPRDIVGRLYDLGFAAIDASKNHNLRQIRTLANLRDTLLPRLISGQLRLPDAEQQLKDLAV